MNSKYIPGIRPVLLAALACVLLAHSVSAADPATGATEYELWISAVTNKAFTSFRPLFDADKPLKLRITAVEGDENVSTDIAGLLGSSRRIQEDTLVTSTGYVNGYTHTSMGTKGGGGGKPLSEELLTQLDALLLKLPDDGGRLPPPNRRLLLQFATGGATTTRVYDRANAPDVVWEILRLCQCPNGCYALDFKAASEIDARGFEPGGFLRLAPDGKQILFTGRNQPLQFWEPVTHELLREVRGLGGDGIAFSPDGIRVVVIHDYDLLLVDPKTWAFRKTQLRSSFMRFTPDGLHLLLNSPDRDLRVVDATTWQLADPLPEIPPDAVCYLPAPGNKRAVAQLKSGAVVLWDVAARRVIAELNPHARLLDMAFSPDESQVVLQTDNLDRRRSEARFSIWSTTTGALVCELRPFERSDRERSQGLCWTPDGHYVLAGVTPGWNSSNAVCVFNAATGKHRGSFTGFTRVNGVVLLPDASQLAVGCEDGKIRFWDFPAAMKSIRELEASLAPQSPP